MQSITIPRRGVVYAEKRWVVFFKTTLFDLCTSVYKMIPRRGAQSTQGKAGGHFLKLPSALSAPQRANIFKTTLRHKACNNLF
jgi:hypothetical protein